MSNVLCSGACICFVPSTFISSEGGNWTLDSLAQEIVFFCVYACKKMVK